MSSCQIAVCDVYIQILCVWKLIRSKVDSNNRCVMYINNKNLYEMMFRLLMDKRQERFHEPFLYTIDGGWTIW